MAKERSEKKAKKERSEKHTDDGVKKSKKDKKSKKEKKLEHAESDDEGETSVLVRDQDGDVDMEADAGGEVQLHVQGALVPFASPLAEDPKEVKKILRTVKKSAKTKTLRRGVKEVVKALRKSTTNGPPSSDASKAAAVVIIAADISPMDVISHIPVLCEDHNIPYIYVKSRAELGGSSATKRATSVVMVCKDRTSKKSKDVKDEDAEEFEEAYGDLLKLVVKASRSVKK